MRLLLCSLVLLFATAFSFFYCSLGLFQIVFVADSIEPRKHFEVLSTEPSIPAALKALAGTNKDADRRRWAVVVWWRIDSRALRIPRADKPFRRAGRRTDSQEVARQLLLARGSVLARGGQLLV